MRRGRKGFAIFMAAMMLSTSTAYVKASDVKQDYVQEVNEIDSTEESTEGTEQIKEDPPIEQSTEEFSVVDTEEETTQNQEEIEPSESTEAVSAGVSEIKASVDIDTYFPDENFKKYVKSHFDLDKDGKLSEEEITQVEEIDVEGMGIRDLSGVEIFHELFYLNGKNNHLTQVHLPESMEYGSADFTGQHIDVNMESVNGEYRINIADLIGRENIKNADLFQLDPLYGYMEDYSDDIKKSGDYLILPSDAIDQFSIGYFSEYDTSISIAVTVSNAKIVNLDKTMFPDDNFRKALKQYDRDRNEKLSYYELRTVDTLELAKKQIKDLKGIEYFPNLYYLNFSENEVTSIDLSKNKILHELACEKNKLESLDFSNNPELYEVQCSQNQLTKLSFPNQNMLEYVDCTDNKIKELDFSGAKNLATVICNDNQLTKLDASGLTKLQSLDCDNNKLNSIIINSSNQLERLSCIVNNLNTLDVTHNPKLRELYCNSNKLGISLDLSKNVKLEYLNCEENNIKTIDLTKNINLIGVSLGYNDISTLDLSKNTKLKDCSASENHLAYVDTKKNVKLEETHFGTQEVYANASYINGSTYVNLADLVGKDNIKYVKLEKNSGKKISGEYLQVDEELEAGNYIYYYINEKNVSIDVNIKIKKMEPHTSHSYTWKTLQKESIFQEGKYKGTCGACGKTVIKTREKLEATMKLTAKNITLKKNQSTTGLKVSGMSKGDSVKSWKSSNTKIVKVTGKSTGTCTLKAGSKTGTATITITLKSGKQETVTVKVQTGTVKTKALKGLSENVTIKKGKSLTLKPTREPFTSGEKITYKSSNTKVATVTTAGVIKGKKAGTAKVTVKSGSISFVVKVVVK